LEIAGLGDNVGSLEASDLEEVWQLPVQEISVAAGGASVISLA
jgi:hypothetical protein